ncbi:MAG: putative transrane protein [Actinomycetia bacterium]|nr:putative transrane protein [Actinomycetes bacterium]
MYRDAPLPVQLVAAGPAQQRRGTVLIRWIMLIPHYVVLYFLNIAFSVVAFIGWWGALFTGWLPEFAVSYLSGFTRWSTRVQAYALLLTDQYPPFSLGDVPGYPVRIAIPPRDKLNRAAILFRVILVIPAILLNGFITFGGTTIVAFIAWLIALITGKLPPSLHLAYTAILRYTTRLNCYYSMLTAAYPRGLFGDGLSAPYGAAVPPAGNFGPAASGYGTPGYGTPSYETSGYETSGYGTPDTPGYGTPGYGTPGTPGYGTPGYETPVDPAAGQLADWRLLLTRGAKQLLGWFIGIGAVLWAAEVVVIPIILSHSVVTTKNAIDTVNAANRTLASELANYQTTVQACTKVACIEKADAQAATGFTNFASILLGTGMPASAAPAANKVYSDATTVAQDLTQLSLLGPTISTAQYQGTTNSVGIGKAFTQFQHDFGALANALNSSRYL